MGGERKADRLLVHISRLKRYYQRPDENHRREQGVDAASLGKKKNNEEEPAAEGKEEAAPHLSSQRGNGKR